MPDEEIQGQVLEVSTVEAQERAQVDMQIATAKRYPRNVQRVKSGILSIATLDAETAASCFYALPRAGKTIIGASIRLAEIGLSQWGNCKVGTRIIRVVADGPNPHVVVQAVCHDLETNVAVSIEKSGVITGKRKNGGNPDPDDINLATNRCTSFAIRDAILKVVPLAVIKGPMDQCIAITKGDAATLGTRRAQCVEALGKMGVTEKMILASFGYKSSEEISLDDLADMRGRYSAIKNDEISIEEAFAPKVSDTAPGATTAAPAVGSVAPPPAAAAGPKAAPKPTPKAAPTSPAPPPVAETAPPATTAAPKPAAAAVGGPLGGRVRATHAPVEQVEGVVANTQQPPFEQEHLPGEEPLGEPESMEAAPEPSAEPAKTLAPDSPQAQFASKLIEAGYGSWDEVKAAIISCGWMKHAVNWKGWSDIADGDAMRLTGAIHSIKQRIEKLRAAK